MAAALALGRRGHRVVVLEAAPKVCARVIESGGNSLIVNVACGGWGRDPSVSEHVASIRSLVYCNPVCKLD